MEVEVVLEYLVALFYFSLIITFSDDLLSGGYVPIMIATIFRRHLFLRPPVLLLVAHFFKMFFLILMDYTNISHVSFGRASAGCNGDTILQRNFFFRRFQYTLQC